MEISPDPFSPFAPRRSGDAMSVDFRMFQRYAFGIALTVLVLFARHFLDPVLQDRSPYALGYVVVMLVAWLWGMGPAIVSSALFWVTGALLWLAPFDPGDAVTITTAGAVFTLLIAVTTRLAGAVKDHKRAERALRETEERYHLVNQATNDILWDWDLASDRLDWNEAVEKAAGRTRAEMPGTIQSWYDHIYPADRDRVVRSIHRAIDGGEDSWSAEYRFGPTGGPYRTYFDRGLIARDASGRAHRMIGSMLDLTERRRAEEAQRKNELFARKVLASSISGIYIYDLPRQHMAYISPEYTRLTGYTLQQVNAFGGDTFLQLFHPDDRPGVAAHIAAAAHAADDEVREIEYRFKTADGRWLWCLSRETVFTRDEDGAVRQYIGTFLDLTARKEAEEALRASEQKFRTVFEQAAIGIGRVRFSDARWIDVNETFCRMLGYTQDEMLRTPWPQITHPDDVELDLVPFRSMAKGELDGYTLEKRFVHKQGHHVWARLTLSLVRDAQGRPDYEIAVIENVTDRRKAEEALEAERGRLHAVLRSLPVAVWIADENGTVIQTSEAAETLWGKAVLPFSIDEYGRYKGWWADTAQPIGPDEWALARAVTQGEVSTGEVIDIERFDGTRGTILHNASPVYNSEGQIIGGVAVAQDITELRQNEQALKESHRRKDEFLAMLGHELRNPLGPISTAAQILKKVGSEQPAVVRARDVIERQVSHMSRLIDDLLDVSRISSGRIELKREMVDLASLMRTFVQDYQPAIEDGGLRLELSLPEEPVWVLGDPARIQQIAGNLLNNAVKFTDPGGTIDMSLVVDRNHAQIIVRDTGIGMGVDVLERLFEPFSQSERSSDRARGGLGLGLALVKGLTELHGGSVTAHSSGPGQGSRLQVRLPLGTQTAARRPQLSVPGTEQRTSHRILIIEDNVDAAEMLETLLSILGHQIHVAGSGAEGVRKAGELRPDVIICDIGLPGGMDGYAVARKLRRDARLSSTYLIAMTGYGQEEDRQRAKEAGFDHHITKPADPEALERLLAHWSA
jgi:PAS domain S-box-containing protein